VLLQLLNLPREIMELPRGHHQRWIAASVVFYALIALVPELVPRGCYRSVL
jgi:hypothetical protein